MEPEPPHHFSEAQVASGPAVVAMTTAPPPEDRVYRDRGTGLVIFGVFQIILGLLTALIIPFMALGAFMSRLAPGGSMRPGQLISGVATYALLAAAFVGLGIGSVQMKRWARALTLVTSWYGLITGALVTILMTAVLPVAMRSALAQSQKNAPGATSPGLSTAIMAVIVTFIIIVAAIFLVVVPIAYVVFYSRGDVAETVRRRDPIERWTDRTPLPVLGASVALFMGSLYMLIVGLTTPLFPFFGRYLTGIPAAACFIAFAALDFYLAFALYGLQLSGWWIAVLTLPVRLLSMILTYLRADPMQAYSKLGMSGAQLRMISSSPIFRGHVVLWWSLLSLVIFWGYLVWLNRYFKAPASATIACPAETGSLA